MSHSNSNRNNRFKQLTDEKNNDFVLGLRQQQQHLTNTSKQPAQDRLKRLQTNLKRIQDKKPVKEKPDNKRPQLRSLSSRLSSKSKSFKTTNEAWQKPQALLDASNRLKNGPTSSVNQRLKQLTNSLQQDQQKEKEKETNNNQPEPEPMDWDDDSEPVRVSVQREAEKSLPDRRLDHMYFVLDTNVLMHDLSFVEQLPKLVLPGQAGSMLYIPYIVIKELDKLKDRHNDDQTKRVSAIRAIRFLNAKFDDTRDIQAQSALEESEHLIEVDCGDDSIVNCCLQLNEQVPHMMLLTNDNNLRLKANASAIKVSCRSDLVKAHPKIFD